MSAIPHDLPVIKDFEPALVEVQKTYQKLKGSFDIFASHYMSRCVNLLPFKLPFIITDILCSKCTVVFTNLLVVKDNLKLNKSDVRGGYYLIAGPG